MNRYDHFEVDEGDPDITWIILLAFMVFLALVVLVVKYS